MAPNLKELELKKKQMKLFVKELQDYMGEDYNVVKRFHWGVFEFNDGTTFNPFERMKDPYNLRGVKYVAQEIRKLTKF